MHKLLTLLVFIATLLLVGCSLTEMPGVYRPNIQQGNVVTQQMVNQLEPQMSKSQVRFILGTPLLVDVFHQDRWDYLYSMDDHSDTVTTERIALYFEDDRLVGIQGDYRPLSQADPFADQEDIVHTVPDYKDRDKGLFGKAMETVGLGSDQPPERVPMEQGEVTEAGTEAVTAAAAEATTATQAEEVGAAPVEDSAVPVEESPAPVEDSTAPVEDSAVPIQAAPESVITTGASIELPEKRATQPAPVRDLLGPMDNPQGE